MNDYLLNQNILIILSAVTAGLVFLFGRFFFKVIKRDKKLVLAAALIVLLFIALIAAVYKLFTLGNVPSSGYYLSFLLIALIVSYGWYFSRFKPRGRVVGLAAIVSCFILLAASINSFYQFYPTLSSLITAKPQPYKGRNFDLSSGNLHTLETAGNLESKLFPQPNAKGQVVAVVIPGTTSHFRARPALVYIPPAYQQYANKNNLFPVLVLLPGIPGSPSDWLHGGMWQATMDEFASRHNGVTPLVVLADQNGTFNNDTECVDSQRGNVETYLSADIPNFIKNSFYADTSPSNWGIGGYSEGGMCAAMITLRHQTAYRHFLDMSGDPMPFLDKPSETLGILFHDSRKDQQQHNINWLLQNVPLSKNMTGQFLIGSDDSASLKRTLRFTYSLAVKHNLPATMEDIPHGGHDFNAWSRGYKDALPEMSYYLGATSCESSCGK